MIPFTQEAFEDFCREHQFSTRTRALIDASFEAPSRRVVPGRKNTKSTVPCPKMGFALIAESHLERACLLDHLFDDTVLGYLEQPHTKLHLDYRRQDGRRIRSVSTADNLVFHWQDGLVLEEVKPWERLVELSRKDPVRYRLAGDRFVSPPAEEAARLYGGSFRFVTERSLPEVRSQNHLILFDYAPVAGRPSPADLDQLNRLFDGRDFFEGRELAPTFDRDIILGAVAHELLFIDMDRNRLVRFDRLIMYRTKEAREALIALHRAAAYSPFDQDLDNVAPGDRLELDGVVLTIHLVAGSQVFLADSSMTALTLDRAVIKEQLECGKAVLIDGTRTLSGPLAKASRDDVIEAQRRIALITGTELAPHLGPLPDVTGRTIRTWGKVYRQAIATQQDPFLALLSARSQRGNRTRRLEEQELALLRHHIESAYLATNGATLESAHNGYKKVASEAGYSPVSIETYRLEIKKYDPARVAEAREGKKSAQNVEGFDEFDEPAVDRHGQYPMGVVHLDHTVLDIFVLSGQTEEQLVSRPVLTLAIDAFTRAIVGMYISLRDVSKESVLGCITDIVRRFRRLPTTLVVDGGSEFYSTDFETTLTHYGTRIQSREGKPRSGNVIERAFGMTNTQVLHNVYGNTKLSRNVRLLTPSVDPTKLACVPLADLMEGLEEYWFEIHNQHWKKKAHFMTPTDKFSKGLRDLGNRRHRRILLDKEFFIRVLPSIKGDRTRVVDGQRGFPCLNDVYNHPIFYSSRGKSKVTDIKLNPWDPSKVFAWYEGTWLECTSRNLAELAGDDMFTRRALYEELPELTEAVRQSHEVAGMAIANVVDRLNAHKDRSKVARKIFESSESASDLAAESELPPTAPCVERSPEEQAVPFTRLPSLTDVSWRKAFL